MTRWPNWRPHEQVSRQRSTTGDIGSMKSIIKMVSLLFRRKDSCCRECGKIIDGREMFCDSECEHEYVDRTAW